VPYGQHIYPIPLGSGMVPTYFCWAPFQAASVGSTVPGQRRSYPKFFKAQVVDECAQAGASVAGVVLSNGLNSNPLACRRADADPNAVACPYPQTNAW